MAGAALAAFAVPALADTTAAAPPPATPTAVDANDSGTIIVSARRRSETLQSTPVAITAINTAMLDAKASVNIGDLTGAAPGLLITQQNSGAQAANLSIRGLSYADIEKSQTPTVGVIVDGVAIGTNTGQLQDVFDIAQIEVLRGPQGTLFGANTIGGVINIQRTLPTMEPGGKVEFSYGQWNTWSGKALVNYGNGSSWGIKGWYYHNQTDGYYHNTTTNSRTGGSKDDSFGASLLFKPAGSNFDAQLTIEDVIQSFTPVNITLTQSGDQFYGFATVPTNLYQVSDAPTFSHYHAPDGMLSLNESLGDIKLTSITGWRHSTESQTQDFGTAGFYYVLRNQKYTQWSQELRAGGKIGSNFDYVVGGYYFNSHYTFTQWTDLGLGDALAVSTAADPATDPAVLGPPALRALGLGLASEQVEYASTKSYAGFGDFNWAFADHFRLSFGGRWTHDEKVLDNTDAQFSGCIPISQPNGNCGLIGNGKAGFSKFTPKAGLDWRPNHDTMLYASWARGYRSGGFSPRAETAQFATTPFQPETVDSYEIGGKFDLFDRKLQLNLAGFVADYKNMQQNLTEPGGPTGNQTITGNVPGGALIKGIEADATLHPMAGLKLTATAAYTDSHFRNYVVGCGTNGETILYCNYSANHLIYAPKFSGSLNAEYTVPTSFGKVVTAVGWRHISPYDEQISNGPVSPASTAALTIFEGNDPRVRTLTQDLVDASATVDFKLHGADAYFRVFGRNLANTQTTTAAFTVAGLFAFGSAIEPRTYGATVGVKF
jgi:iron complex outermembrane receptor protein